MNKIRADKIIEYMKMNNDTASVAQLCAELDVSDMTIRRDLQHLEQNKRVIRHHGGASLVQTIYSPYVAEPLNTRTHTNHELKQQLGHIASVYLNKICTESNCSSIFFASGTTVESVVSQIDFDLKNVTLVTDNLIVSQKLVSNPDNTVIMIGGQLILPSLNSVGHMAEKMISSFSYDYAFIGAAAIDENGYVYTYNFIEAGTFFAIVAATRNLIVVADATKINKKTFVQLFQLQKGHVLITNKSAPAAFTTSLESRGVAVITA